MNNKKKQRVYILDTSAILSGKPLIFEKGIMVTSNGVSNELQPGGRNYNNFQILLEKGLIVKTPLKSSMKKIEEIIKETGDLGRLSETDKEILALSIEINNQNEKQAIILTDDYSIQNVANNLNIIFEPINQSGITKRFIWTCRCRGCGKKFKENINICPICGTETKTVISNKKRINK